MTRVRMTRASTAPSSAFQSSRQSYIESDQRLGSFTVIDFFVIWVVKYMDDHYRKPSNNERNHQIARLTTSEGNLSHLSLAIQIYPVWRQRGAYEGLDELLAHIIQLLVKVLLVEGSEGANDGEKYRTQTSQHEVWQAKRRTKCPDSNHNDEYDNSMSVNMKMRMEMMTLSAKYRE